MSLTGTPFFVVLIAVTVVVIAGTLVFWSIVPGPRLMRGLARLVMILLCQLTAIAVVATWINTSYGLYSSWSDLFGTNTNPDSAAMPGPPPTRAQFTHAQGGTPAGGLLDTYFHGPHSQLSGQVIVWTPPQYDEPGYATARFPVLMLLHGVPGSPQSWLEHGGMPDDFKNLVAQNHAHPFILVMPVVNPGSVDTDCSDVPNRKVATWLAADVPELISQKFRTITGPRGWGVMGFSTGGYCAAKLPLQYPHVFGAGAALDPDPLTGDPDVISDPQLRRRNSPTWLVQHTKADVDLFLATSRQDPDSPPRYLAQFAQAAAASGSGVRVQTTVLPTGGHNYNTWTSLYPAAFGWLSDWLDTPQHPATMLAGARNAGQSWPAQR
ncbi:alpha/beta hydrolase-fold protein [Streptomyces sp. RB6PN25]|uniref:Alpha/beta hydrolase-fold protein n=1 Tax=Streptomyces humicola TaxID=2953240 RepID=A0ABT1Q0T2_9ACTN|nr:alpha/beta fold hydrolase [Streptomyces humicola]MCQ4082357.1 alpha/beta hydrolase-fold protein [Streptomyces humicola]